MTEHYSKQTVCPSAKVYELAQNLKEAEELRDAGFGFETREDAEKAKHARNGMDSYYRNLLKVFELKARKAVA